MNKLHPFQSSIYSSSFDIVALTETWLSDRIYDQEILPSGYILYRSDRESRGGGVMICVSTLVPSRLIESHLSIDMVTIEITTTPSLIISCVYIPPNCSDAYLMATHQSIEDLAKRYQNLIILGDFNSPDICWATLHGSSPSSRSLCIISFSNII